MMFTNKQKFKLGNKNCNIRKTYEAEIKMMFTNKQKFKLREQKL